MQTRIVRQVASGSAAGEDCPDGIAPLLWAIYRRRGVRSAAELERELTALFPPDRLGGVDDAVEVLAEAIAAGRRILIVGDFDADGATSCALAVLALQAFGHANVRYLVPNRFEFGYGLTPEIVEYARSLEPELLVTVDNGISSVAGVAAANALGWRVIVTDHHLAGGRLPEALALVNPNLPDDPFPSKALAGVGVIFYVLLALRRRLRESGWFERRGIPVPNMAAYLDLVALGTVADVVPLDHNNRILVHQGMARIRNGQCRPGITALLTIAGRNPARVRATDMAFAVGPRLNAAGRIDDMSLGIECLLAGESDEAHRLARELDRLNRERQSIEAGMRAEAEAILDDWSPVADDALPWGLCLYRPDWHQGVIGILASRVKERHHRPVIVFADAGDGLIKGSARSVPGLHIRDALDEVAVRRPGLLEKFGGHAMAAGMTLGKDAFAAFADAFDEVVRARLHNDDLRRTIQSDGAIAGHQMNLETARAIIDAGPWGQGFPEPVFDGLFEVVSSRVVGQHHWKLVVCPRGSGEPLDAIAFNAVADLPHMPTLIRAAYRLDENEWQGRVSLQLRFDYIEATES